MSDTQLGAIANADARRLAFLEQVARATAERSDHADLLRTIIDEATEATGTQVCSLYLWDDVHRQLVLTATNGLSQSGVGAVRLGLGEGVTVGMLVGLMTVTEKGVPSCARMMSTLDESAGALLTEH